MADVPFQQWLNQINDECHIVDQEDFWFLKT